MRIITSNTFNTPYPDKCPEWCKVGALVKSTVTRNSPILGKYKDNTVYEIVQIHWFDPVEAKGIWGAAYMRPKGTSGRHTVCEYICDIIKAE